MAATDSYNTEQLKRLLKSDRRIACEEMALRNHVKMRKVSARWVPHRLTSDQAERCLEVAIHLLSRFDSEGQDFFYQELLQLTKRG